MKKICFFSGDITRSGGTERVAAMIANGLQQTGRYEIVFLSLVEKNKDTFFRWILRFPDMLWGKNGSVPVPDI